MTRAEQSSVPMERLVWTSGVVVGASLPHWLELPIWIPTLLMACVAWRLAGKLAHWPLPNRAVRLALAFLAFTGVLVEYSTVNGVEAGSALLVVMVALKFLESHTHRDQIVLMIIAYFLVFASLLYAGGILKGIYLLVFVWVTTVGLLQLGRRNALLPSWPAARYAAKLLLQSVPIMAVLFVLFPRLPGPLWAIPRDPSSATSGLDDEMSPGDITDLGLSDEVAFRVEFDGGVPSPNDLYWRGPVLRDFNGRTWSRSPGMRRRVLDTLEHEGEAYEYRVMLEPTGRDWIFALDMPKTFGPVGRRNVVMGSDYQLRAFGLDGFDARIEYNVTSHTRYRALEPLTERERALFTELPPSGNPRTREIAASWLDDNPTPDEIIERALDVFRAETFYYTLTPPPLGADSVDDFIFDTREGFCEHYASAFAFMLRAAGIPTRIVTGYQGGELNGFGDYYIIRQSDAHAWTEVWLGDRGWVRADPLVAVAPERISLGATRSTLGGETAAAGRRLTRLPWLRPAMLVWDSANTYWNKWIIGYGPQMQRSLLRLLGMERPRWARLLTLAVGTTIVLLALLTGYLTWSFRKERHVDAAQLSFARFTRRLRRHDVVPRRPGETATEYGRRAKLKLPRSADEIDRVVETYLAARYEPDSSRGRLNELEQLVKRFRADSVRA